MVKKINSNDKGKRGGSLMIKNIKAWLYGYREFEVNEIPVPNYEAGSWRARELTAMPDKGNVIFRAKHRKRGWEIQYQYYGYLKTPPRKWTSGNTLW